MRMTSIRNKYSLWFIYTIIVFQVTIILFPGWREDDVAFFLIRLKHYLFGNAIDGFSLNNQTERFIPFYYFGYQLISYFTFKPFFFFLYNLFLSISTLVLLQIIRIKLELKHWPIFIFLVFVPGYADSFFQLVNPEKELIFFWSLFLYTILIQLENGSKNFRNSFLGILSFSLIIFSLFLKETTFIILTTFCSSFLILNSKIFSPVNKIQINKTIKYILFSGIIFSFSFLIMFFVFTNGAPEKEGYYYLLNPAESIVIKIIYSLKALILYSISDPLLTLVLPVFFSYSVYQRIVSKKEIFIGKMFKFGTFIDACAVSALSLVVAYVVLGFHGFRYLLPAYPFGLIAIAAYFQIYVPKIKKYFKYHFIFFPSIILIILLFNSFLSTINLAVFYKLSSFNFMQYKDVLLKKIDRINLNYKNSVSFYIPGKSEVWMKYSASRHKDILNFYEVDIKNINFKYIDSNQNWQEKKKVTRTDSVIKKGDIFLILPNSNISQDEIISNLGELTLNKIIHTNSPNYFEIPEIRHLLKYIVLSKKPNLLGTRMVYREVDYAIYEVL